MNEYLPKFRNPCDYFSKKIIENSEKRPEPFRNITCFALVYSAIWLTFYSENAHIVSNYTWLRVYCKYILYYLLRDKIGFSMEKFQLHEWNTMNCNRLLVFNYYKLLEYFSIPCNWFKSQISIGNNYLLKIIFRYLMFLSYVQIQNSKSFFFPSLAHWAMEYLHIELVRYWISVHWGYYFLR